MRHHKNNLHIKSETSLIFFPVRLSDTNLVGYALKLTMRLIFPPRHHNGLIRFVLSCYNCTMVLKL